MCSMGVHRGQSYYTLFPSEPLRSCMEVDVLSLESALYVRILESALHPSQSLFQQGFRVNMAYRVLGFYTLQADAQPYLLLCAGKVVRRYVPMQALRAVAHAPEHAAYAVPLSDLMPDHRLPLSLMPFCTMPSYFLEPQALGVAPACSDLTTA